MLKNGLNLNKRTLLSSLEETFKFGRDVLGKQAISNSIFCFFGPLGVGKTTLIKGIGAGYINLDPHLITSPTFSLLNIYEGLDGKFLFHFDLYRLKSVDQFYSLGFEEYLEADGLCCIEWSEKIWSQIPKNGCFKKIILSYGEEKERYCDIIEE